MTVNINDFKNFTSTHKSRNELLEKLNSKEKKMFVAFVKSVGV